MKNLINFFFSFDKLMKEKLVIAFFWLAIIVFGLNFFSEALSAIKLGPLASVVKFVNFFGGILLTLVSLRLLSELAVAVFRINDNLSPDGGKSETADIDPITEARKAAEAAAIRARELSKTAGEKASAATKTAVEKTKHAADDVASSASKARSRAVGDKKGSTAVGNNAAAAGRGSTVTKPKPKTGGAKTSTPRKAAAKKASTTKTKTTAAPKKRGRPAGSKNKAAATKAKRTSTGRGKPGPKPGSKAKRDAKGRLLKKDGTLRGKPGPKKKS